MNKLCCLIGVFITCGVCSGQNLVPNPSFEDTLHCPGFPTPNISSATGWDSYYGTPDYFNPCANTITPQFGVPFNLDFAACYQNPYHGSAYAGLLTWFVNAGSPIREYMGAELIQPLIIGTKYFASCYISNADSSPSNSSSNKFGFKFSTIAYPNSPQSVQLLMNNFSHIHSDSVITDKINWTRMAGSFIADSTYQYLILGNFYDDVNTTVDTVPPFGAAGSYYYIDAIVVSTDSLTTVGVNEIKGEEELILFPNPFTDKVNIKTKRNELLEVSLYDVTSRKLLQLKFTNSVSLNTEQLGKGIYLYEVRNKNGVIKKGKVVKD